MNTFEIAETICAVQREILRSTAKSTNLMWTQAIEIADLMVKQNPFVPERGRKVLCSFLESYLDFIEKKRRVLEVMNGASEDIMSFVCRSVRFDKKLDGDADISEQVLNVVKTGTQK
ncbi:MAG TPA: hypothetical protein ENG51_00670 [Deltaproteobacteria bacterium]|nr:hypothetical protein [Deltaproteobacteria bacterium]